MFMIMICDNMPEYDFYIYACVEGELHLKTLPKISCDNYICFAIIKITGIMAFGPTDSRIFKYGIETQSIQRRY